MNLTLLNKRRCKRVHTVLFIDMKSKNRDFPGGPVVKNPPSNAGDAGSIPVGELGSHMTRGN